MDQSYTIHYKRIADIPILAIHAKDLSDKEEHDLIIGYHGWTNVKESVLTQGIEFARQGYLVILPDAYLHGERRPENYSYKPLVDLPQTLVKNVEEFPVLLEGLKKQLSLASLSVFGTSMGGMTVSLLVSKYAEKLTGAAQYIASVDVSQVLQGLKETKFEAASADGLSQDEVKDLEKHLSFIDQYNLADQLEKISHLAFYAYNGGADDWVDSSINFDLMPKVQANYPQAAIKYDYYPEEDHWVPFDIIQKSAIFLKKEKSE